MTSAACEVLWLINFVKYLRILGLTPINFQCDKKETIQIATNPVCHKKIKHFEIDLHVVRGKYVQVY